MADFSIPNNDFLLVEATPFRNDLTAGTTVNDDSYTIDDPTKATLEPNIATAKLVQLKVTPVASETGIVNVTVSNVDENGAPVHSSFSVAITAAADLNPTVGFHFTQLHP